MKKVILTMLNGYQTNHRGERDGDESPKLIAVGYDVEAAREAALEQLKYDCCLDFTRPSTMKPHNHVDYFKAEGYAIETDDDYVEASEKLDLGECDLFSIDGCSYILPPDYFEYSEGGTVSSDEVRRFESWSDYLESQKKPAEKEIDNERL